MADFPTLRFLATMGIAPVSQSGTPGASQFDNSTAGQARQAASVPLNNNLQPLTVLIQPAGKPDPKKPAPTLFPYAPASGTPAAPTSPNVYVHIWEVEKFTSKTDQDAHDRRQIALLGQTGAGTPAPTAATPQNHFLCSLGGYIQEVLDNQKKASYEFRILQSPKWSTDTSVNQCGCFGMFLKNPDGGQWGAPDKTPYCMPILGACESEVDLACVLQTSGDPDNSLADAGWEDVHCFHMTNLVHIIQSQMDEGGISMAFFADIGSADGDAEAKNDYSFRGFGRMVAQRLLCVGYDVNSDQLVIGATGVTDRSQVAAVAKTILDKINGSPILSIPKDKPAQIYRLALCTHGWHKTTQANSKSWHNGKKDGDYLSGFKLPGKSVTMDQKSDPSVAASTVSSVPSATVPDVELFLRDFVPLLSPDVILSLFACATTLGDDEPDDTCANPPPKGKKLGAGSVAEGAFLFLRRLPSLKQAAGASGQTAASPDRGPVVWGHTAYGQAVHNYTLRCFANHYDLGAPQTQDGYDVEGARDIFWAKPGNPPPWIATPGTDPKVDRGPMAGWFNTVTAARSNQIIDLTTSRPGKTMQAFLGKIPDNCFPKAPATTPSSSSSNSTATPVATGSGS